jgi:hypothetical protein
MLDHSDTIVCRRDDQWFRFGLLDDFGSTGSGICLHWGKHHRLRLGSPIRHSRDDCTVFVDLLGSLPNRIWHLRWRVYGRSSNLSVYERPDYLHSGKLPI